MFYSGSLWKFVEGEADGQTATDCNRIDQESIFSHPIDLHLACRGIQGEADKNEIMRKPTQSNNFNLFSIQFKAGQRFMLKFFL